eukprot:364330-Chlamydomonas_euryale.AAC.4
MASSPTLPSAAAARPHTVRRRATPHDATTAVTIQAGWSTTWLPGAASKMPLASLSPRPQASSPSGTDQSSKRHTAANARNGAARQPAASPAPRPPPADAKHRYFSGRRETWPTGLRAQGRGARTPIGRCAVPSHLPSPPAAPPASCCHARLPLPGSDAALSATPSRSAAHRAAAAAAAMVHSACGTAAASGGALLQAAAAARPCLPLAPRNGLTKQPAEEVGIKTEALPAKSLVAHSAPDSATAALRDGGNSGGCSSDGGSAGEGGGGDWSSGSGRSCHEVGTLRGGGDAVEGGGEAAKGAQPDSLACGSGDAGDGAARQRHSPRQRTRKRPPQEQEQVQEQQRPLRQRRDASGGGGGDSDGEAASTLLQMLRAGSCQTSDKAGATPSAAAAAKFGAVGLVAAPQPVSTAPAACASFCADAMMPVRHLQVQLELQQQQQEPDDHMQRHCQHQQRLLLGLQQQHHHQDRLQLLQKMALLHRDSLYQQHQQQQQQQRQQQHQRQQHQHQQHHQHHQQHHHQQHHQHQHQLHPKNMQLTPQLQVLALQLQGSAGCVTTLLPGPPSVLHTPSWSPALPCCAGSSPLLAPPHPQLQVLSASSLAQAVHVQASHAVAAPRQEAATLLHRTGSGGTPTASTAGKRKLDLSSVHPIASHGSLSTGDVAAAAPTATAAIEAAHAHDGVAASAAAANAASPSSPTAAAAAAISANSDGFVPQPRSAALAAAALSKRLGRSAGGAAGGGLAARYVGCGVSFAASQQFAFRVCGEPPASMHALLPPRLDIGSWVHRSHVPFSASATQVRTPLQHQQQR